MAGGLGVSPNTINGILLKPRPVGGEIHSDLGQVDKAREYLEAAQAIAQEIKDPRIERTVISLLEKP